MAVLAAEACRDSGLRPVYDHFLSEWWRRGLRAEPLWQPEWTAFSST